MRRFRADDVPAIERFNARLAAAGLPYRVGPEDLSRLGEPSLESEPIIERLFVAANGEEIHGAVWLKEQMFWSGSRAWRVGWAKYPVAESLIDGKAAGVPAGLLFALRREQSHLMALGMGGHAGRFAKILAAARWASSSLPFFFRLLRPARVLRQLAHVRTTPLRRLLADGLAWSGLAWTGNTVLTTALTATKPRRVRSYSCRVVDRFDTWADELWSQCRDAYGFIAVRDMRALNSLYNDRLRRLVRLRVQRGGDDVGWICVRAIDAAGTWFERHFGSLRLGILTDALARPEDAAGVMAAGFRYLADDGVDLVITYQSHPSWHAAAKTLGFMPGPSNCAFYRSPAIDDLMRKEAAMNRYSHVTASDGDGPEPV